MEPAVVFTFAAYFIVLLAVGLFFYKRSAAAEEYWLGGRAMGAWVTAFSAQASDMSGWLLMGLPGAVYLGGLQEAWIAAGLLAGTVLNWYLLAPRLRIFTQQTNALTLPSFLEQRFVDPSGLLRLVSAAIILLFFTLYAASGLVATSKLFESTFSISYPVSVLLGGSIIILYTFLGGFKAVCWTDLLQGALMIFAVVVVPLMAVWKTDTIDWTALFRCVPEEKSSGLFFFSVLSALSWGLGYFGQPHILARFMAVKSLRHLHQSAFIGSLWAAAALAGALAIGQIGAPMFPGLSGGEEEKIFIYLIRTICSPWLTGIMLSAILSAIMSTIDSQLLVSASALTEDLYRKTIQTGASEKTAILVSRLGVLGISATALLLALNPRDTILKIVAYAWGGLGAAFGPVLLAALFSRKTTWYSALAGMLAGTLTLILWKQLGLSHWLYELAPGFAANTAVLMTINSLFPQTDAAILQNFETAIRQVRQTGQ
ncbi:MAG TPA: sodium/proline symporter PutP [Anaerohalosphaeraceae bacterium]|nr:sodium/proline symporter PutP [Anaerohalosphaeraceae bacterium]